MQQECLYCHSSDTEIIKSYKHNWIVCVICQNVTRQLKKKLPLDLFKFFSRFTSKNITRFLWHEEAVVEENDVFYEYYGDEVLKNPADTVWKNQLTTLEKKFNECSLTIEGPVLDISGGPGFFVKELSEKGIFAIATEFSDKAVRKMRSVLGINCVTYDYNTHSLTEKFDQQKFKTVLIRSSINFCHNPEKFCNELKSIVETNGLVYVDFALPSLGACLRWQHDEYTYEHFWHPHTICRYFEAAGFKLINTALSEPLHALTDRFIGFKKTPHISNMFFKSIFTILFTLPYYLKARRARAINRSMQQRIVEFIFKKIDE